MTKLKSFIPRELLSEVHPSEITQKLQYLNDITQDPSKIKNIGELYQVLSGTLELFQQYQQTILSNERMKKMAKPAIKILASIVPGLNTAAAIADNASDIMEIINQTPLKKFNVFFKNKIKSVAGDNNNDDSLEPDDMFTKLFNINDGLVNMANHQYFDTFMDDFMKYVADSKNSNEPIMPGFANTKFLQYLKSKAKLDDDAVNYINQTFGGGNQGV